VASFNLTDQTNLFKINYYKKSANMYNSFNVLHGRAKKRYDFTGKQKFVATPLSFSGGVGSGTLPTANAGNYEGAIIVAKKVYARAEIDRESIKASANKEGAFVEATKETVQKTVESYMRNCSRILFSDGSGLLGRGDATGANVTVIAGGYRVEIPSAFWNEAYWEEKDYVQVVTGLAAAPAFTGGTAEATLLEVDAVDPANRTVDLLGSSVRLAALAGANPLAATDGIVMQGSYLNDPQGLKGVADATVGVTSLYGITAQRRWQMEVSDVSGAGINPDRMNGVMLNIERKFGKVPKMICTSYTQFRKILDFMEDQKVYNLPNRNIKGNLSFQGVEFMSTRGPVGIFADRFCDEDRMYFLNDDFVEVHHRPGFGWFDDDGTVFLRGNNTDDYEARYGGYYENYITPTAHGCLKGLAV
jgi:hypothetical protein